jgi:hypothetical protein
MPGYIAVSKMLGYCLSLPELQYDLQSYFFGSIGEVILTIQAKG